MRGKIRHVIALLLVCFLGLLATACGTFFNVRVTSPLQWLEGKDYTVQFSMANADKARTIVLYYRMNELAYKVVTPRAAGALYEFVIPAAELAAGRLEYYVTVTDDKGKEHKEAVIAVYILSRAEGKAQAERDLLGRVQLQAPSEIGINSDLTMTLAVSRPREKTAVTLFLKQGKASRFNERTIAPEAGRYTVFLRSRELEAGELNYYFRIAERHPDFGDIEVTYPPGGNAKPLSVRILSLDEIKAGLERELAAGIIHEPHREAAVTEDLSLRLRLEIPRAGMLALLLDGEPEVTLWYGNKSARTGFRSLPMTRDKQGVYTAVIPRRALSGGANTYYFTVSAATRDVGKIELEYPAVGAGQPFAFRVLSLEELRERREQEYATKLSHTPPKGITVIAPCELELTVMDPPEKRGGVLHFKKASQRTYREVPLVAFPDGLKGTIPREDLEEGVMVYYFTALFSFTDVGETAFDIPIKASLQPFSVKVENKQITYEHLKDDILLRAHHQPLTQVKEGEDARVAVEIKDAGNGTEVTLFLRRGNERSWLSSKAMRRGNEFSAVINRVEIQAGYNQYYLEIAEPHSYFRTVSAALPAAGKDKPFAFTVLKELDIFISSIEHVPVKEVPAGQKLKLHVQIKQAGETTTVSFVYDVKNPGVPGRSFLMTKSGKNFFAEIDESVLEPGVTIEYFFNIRPAAGKPEFIYPASPNPKYTFTVEGKDDKKSKN